MQILFILMDSISEAEEISLHAAVVKNQLILSITISANKENHLRKDLKKYLKNHLKKYLKKYDGTLYITDNQKDRKEESKETQQVIQTIIIGLRRN